MGLFSQDFVGGSTGAADFSGLLGGSGGGSTAAAGGTDLSALLGGLSGALGMSGGGSGGGAAGFLGGAASGAVTGLAFGPIGAGIGAGLGGIMSLFSKPAFDHERGDLQKIGAANNITDEQAGWVCGYEEQHVRDNYDAIVKRAANDNSYFLSLLSKYNAAHRDAPVTPGPTQEQVAAKQQQLITTATTTLGFANTATGQQLVNSLAALPANQAVGTQGQTAGDILSQILKGIGDGALKGGSDAAAETDLGKSMKKDYLKTWVNENQLLAAGIGAFGVFGVVKLFEALRGRGGKISL